MWVTGFLPSYPYTHSASAARMREVRDPRNGDSYETPFASLDHLAQIPMRVKTHVGIN